MDQDYSNYNLLAPYDLKLNNIAEEVTDKELTSPGLKSLVDRMLGLVRGEQFSEDQRRSMVSLAATQLGANKRVIVVNVAATGGIETNAEYRVFINPKLLMGSEDKYLDKEGCYSTGRVWGAVYRSNKVGVQYHNTDGEVHTAEYDGFVARMMQHEIDHLNGVRFPDRIVDDNNLHWVELGQYGEYVQNWQNWGVKTSRTKWNNFKHGIAPQG